MPIDSGSTQVSPYDTDTMVTAPQRSEMSPGHSPAGIQETGSPASTHRVERVLWMLWLQGFENAPEVVKVCLQTWKTLNPGWRIIELSEANLADYIDADSLARLASLNVKRPKLANLIRIYLIGRHGGVWADATCLCRQPLDTWIDRYMESGFFAFRSPGRDRVMSNWFLASRKANPLATIFFDEHIKFLLENKFPLQHTLQGAQRVKKVATFTKRSARLAELWTHPLMIRAVKAYPYFIFHYHFASVVRRNPVCRAIWEKTPALSALGPLRLSRAGLLSPMTAELMEEFRTSNVPFYKLRWHYQKSDFKPGCVLDFAIRSVS